MRIGCVKYLNARPLIHGWAGAVVFDHPAVLCRMLSAGELDVALVSSFEFLRNPEYAIVDGVAVASNGPVYSVYLAHRNTLAEIEEIEADSASHTSVNLLRCLLAGRPVSPRVITASSGACDEMPGQRARLLIGDQAIAFRQRHATDYTFTDLATWWREATGLPFVFALWLIRPEVEDRKQIADALRRLRDDNLRSLDQLIAAQSSFSPDFCTQYFREYLHFDFAEPEKTALLKFASLCQKHGILPHPPATLRLV